MELELKHLAPYLPYGLKLICDADNEVEEMRELSPNGITTSVGNCYTYDVKPLLLPLSEWRKIENGTLFFSPFFHSMQDMDGGIEHNIMSTPYYDLQLLFVHHYDVFGLISSGLAIDSTTIDK